MYSRHAPHTATSPLLPAVSVAQGNAWRSWHAFDLVAASCRPPPSDGTRAHSTRCTCLRYSVCCTNTEHHEFKLPWRRRTPQLKTVKTIKEMGEVESDGLFEPCVCLRLILTGLSGVCVLSRKKGHCGDIGRKYTGMQRCL